MSSDHSAPPRDLADSLWSALEPHVRAALERHKADLLPLVRAEIDRAIRERLHEFRVAKRVLRTAEAARYLRIAPSKLRRLTAEGVVPASVVDGVRRYRVDDLDRYLAREVMAA